MDWMITLIIIVATTGLITGAVCMHCWYKIKEIKCEYCGNSVRV